MKTKLVVLLSLSMLLAIPLVKAQTPAAPPADFKPDKDVNYAQYEGMVKNDVAWYEKTPLDQDTALKRKIATFLVMWITGAPNVTVSLGETIMPVLKDKKNIYSADLLIVYMGGVVVYELNNPNDKDEANIEVAGLQAVLELAKNNTTLLSDSKAVKKFKGMSHDDLMKYVKDCLAKQSK